MGRVGLRAVDVAACTVGGRSGLDAGSNLANCTPPIPACRCKRHPWKGGCTRCNHSGRCIKW